MHFSKTYNGTSLKIFPRSSFFPVTIYYYLVKAFIKLLLRGHICEDLKGLKHDSGTEFLHTDLSVLCIHLKTVR